jgi:hypothetical protein
MRQVVVVLPVSETGDIIIILIIITTDTTEMGIQGTRVAFREGITGEVHGRICITREVKTEWVSCVGDERG